MIGRALWIAAIVAVGLLTTLLQFDLQSRSRAALADVIPEPLRNFAQAQIVREALAGDDPARALAEAERLVRRRPLPAENLTLLAAAQAKAGKLEAAQRTIQIAGQRGWREPVSQEAVLRIALAAGDKAEAARRYAALFLSARTPDTLLEELGPAILSGPDSSGRDAMVAIVIGGERWHSQFLRRGPRVMPREAFAQIVAASIDRGALFECGGLVQAYRTILRDNRAIAETIVSEAEKKRCPQLSNFDR